MADISSLKPNSRDLSNSSNTNVSIVLVFKYLLRMWNATLPGVPTKTAGACSKLFFSIYWELLSFNIFSFVQQKSYKTAKCSVVHLWKVLSGITWGSSNMARRCIIMKVELPNMSRRCIIIKAKSPANVYRKVCSI